MNNTTYVTIIVLIAVFLLMKYNILEQMDKHTFYYVAGGFALLLMFLQYDQEHMENGTAKVSVVVNPNADKGKAGVVVNPSIDEGRAGVVVNPSIDEGRAGVVVNTNIDEGWASVVVPHDDEVKVLHSVPKSMRLDISECIANRPWIENDDGWSLGPMEEGSNMEDGSEKSSEEYGVVDGKDDDLLRNVPFMLHMPPSILLEK